MAVPHRGLRQPLQPPRPGRVGRGRRWSRPGSPWPGCWAGGRPSVVFTGRRHGGRQPRGQGHRAGRPARPAPHHQRRWSTRRCWTRWTTWSACTASRWTTSPRTSTAWCPRPSSRPLIRPDTTLVSCSTPTTRSAPSSRSPRLAAVAREHGVPFHTDAVQAAGWLPLDVERLGVDALSLSGHKVGAPKGVGVLWRPRPAGPGAARPRRRPGARPAQSGTENVAGAVALATALAAAEAERADVGPRTCALRDRFIDRVLRAVPERPADRAPAAAAAGDGVVRASPGRTARPCCWNWNGAGSSAPRGSACAAGSDEPSHVLTALGMPAELAKTAVRFTFGPASTDQDAALAAEAVRDAVAAVQGLQPNGLIRSPGRGPARGPRGSGCARGPVRCGSAQRRTSGPRKCPLNVGWLRRPNPISTNGIGWMVVP